MVKLIKANIRKDRNVLLAFLLILILSSLLLHTGLFVGQYSSIYDEKAEKTHEADVLSYVTGSDEEITSALRGVEEISDFSIQDMISPGSPEVTINDSTEIIELDGATITRYGEYGAAEPYRMIESDASITGAVVYLNSYYAKVNHIHVGDAFHIHFKVTGDLDLRVAGIFEALIGGNAYGWMEIMVDKPARLLCPWHSLGKNTGVGCHPLLQGLFLTQGLNVHLLGLLHWQAGFLFVCLFVCFFFFF